MTIPRAHEVGTRPPYVFVVHGILGAGRNWRSFCRRLSQESQAGTFVLVELRNHAHGHHPPGPHTVAACAGDLERLAREIGPPAAVIGHSFGAKVALTYARDHGSGLSHVFALDSPPGPSSDDSEALAILDLLCRAPLPAASRQSVRDHLLSGGLSEAVAAWLLTSLRSGPEGWTWGYDLDAIEEMIRDYLAADLRPFLASPERFGFGGSITLVRAGASDRWTPEQVQELEGLGAPVEVVELPGAGHWLHVDDPEGLLQLISPRLAATASAPHPS